MKAAPRSRRRAPRHSELHPHPQRRGRGPEQTGSQVANKLAQRQGQALYQGGRGDDLLAFGQAGLLVNVHHLQFVAAFQVLLAKALDGGDRALRFGCHPGHVEPQTILLVVRLLDRLFELTRLVLDFGALHKLAPSLGRKSKPAKTRSILDKSP